MPLTSPTAVLLVGEGGGGQFPPSAIRHILFRQRDGHVDRKPVEGFIRLLPRVIHVCTPVNKNNTDVSGMRL